MEEKRYGIFNSIMDTAKAIASEIFSKIKKTQNDNENNKKLSAEIDRIIENSEKNAAALWRSLNGGGTSGMGHVLEMGDNKERSPENKNRINRRINRTNVARNVPANDERYR